MPGSEPPIVRYWDSPCFLSLLNSESTAPACQRILDLADARKTTICVSPLVQIEVVRPPGPPTPMPEEVRDRVQAFFRRDHLLWRNIDQDIAAISQVVCWDFGVHPRDAAHLAAALDAGCHLFETFDKRLLSLNDKLPNGPMRNLLTGDAERSPLRIAAPGEIASGSLFAP